MRLNQPIFVYIFIAILFIISCSANKYARFQAIDQAVSNRDFQAGIRLIEEAQQEKSPLYNKNNAVSLFLDLGFLKHYAQEYRDSSTDLLNAERLIQEAFTRSITQSVATYIVNDNVREYPGEDFEDIYISVFNAINFFKMGDTDGALVEIRKLTLPSGKLDMLERKYAEANEKAKKENEAALQRAQNTPGASVPEYHSVSFINSALARYLSILFYQSDRNYDGVRIEMEQLRAAFATQPGIYNHSLPNCIQNIESPSSDYVRLDVISFIGLSPIKEEKSFLMFFPFFTSPTLQYAELKLPVLVERPNKIDRIEVVVNNERFNMELLENMGAVIKDTFNARFSQIFLKTYLRTLTKYIATEIGTNAIANDDNQNLQSVVRLAGRIISDLSEKADIRMTRVLPNKAYIGNINLEPGTYDVTINYYSRGTLIDSDIKNDVVVANNRLNLIDTTFLDM